MVVSAYVGIVSGLSLLLDPPSFERYALFSLGLVAATVAFMLIARARTPGRWR